MLVVWAYHIRRATTCLSGIKDGNEDKKGLGSTGKRGKMGMRALRMCWRNQRLVCRCLLCLQKKNVCGHCYILFILQMSVGLVQWWSRGRTPTRRSRVMGGCKRLILFLWRFLLFFGEEELRLCLYFFMLWKKR